MCCVCGAAWHAENLSLSLSVPSLPSFSSVVLFLFLSLLVTLSFSARFSSFLSPVKLSVFLFSMTMTMAMIARPVGSLSVHGPDLPECQCAWAVAPSLQAEHRRTMQETHVLAFLCKPLGDVFVFGCVWSCSVVLVCVVFVVLLVASVLAPMRWLLCGGDVFLFFSLQKFLQFQKTRERISKILNPHKITNITDLLYSKKKTIKSAPRISVIIFEQMVAAFSVLHREIELRLLMAQLEPTHLRW